MITLHSTRSRIFGLMLGLMLGLVIAAVLLALPLRSLPGHRQAAAQSDATLYLPLLAAVTPPIVSSFDLIEQALGRGEIDGETALVYQVFALFADPRLPAQFQGSGGEEFDHGVMRRAAGQFASLSPQARGELTPFFLPPIYLGSWHDRYDLPPPQAAGRDRAPAAACPHQAGAYHPKDGWSCTDSANGKVRVWWRDDMPGVEKKADLVAVQMDIEIWDSLTTLMGREPLPDPGPIKFIDLLGEEQEWGNGGDGKLDIYLVDVPIRAAAMTVAYPPRCDATPAYMVIAPTISEKDLPSVVAHEFMHAVQYAFDVAKACDGDEYRWIDEATAEWASDHVYPDDNFEQGLWDKAFFRGAVNQPLDASYGYDVYPFPLYLARAHEPKLIKTIWEKMTQFDSLEAVDEALADLGGLDAVWPQFALANWNQGPIDDYREWDGITLGAITVGTAANAANRVETITLNNAQDGEYKLDAEVPHLAAQYYHFVFTGTDVRSVAFQNVFNIFHGLEASAKVQALVKIEGQEWAVEDWTEQQSMAYCRDRKAERIQELVIIISNSKWEDREHVLKFLTPPRLVVSNIGCWRWRGTVSGTLVDEDVTITTGANVTFEHHAFPGIPPGVTSQIYYDVAGTVSWRMQGSLGNCTLSGGPHTVPAENIVGEMSVYNYDVTGLHRREYFGIGNTSDFPLEYTQTCPGSGSTTRDAGSASWLFTNDVVKVSTDGSKMDGTAVVNLGAGGTETFTWHFTAVREP